MSKVAIAGNASGTGTFTIAAPNSNTDRTLTLPDEAGTVIVTDGTTLYVDNANNKVGIATDSPVAELDVRGVLSVSNGPTSYWAIDRDNSSGALTFDDVTTERMRIDGSGRLLVNTTVIGASNLTGFSVVPYSAGIYTEFCHTSSGANGDSYAVFRHNGTTIGGIVQNGTTAVQYNTSSDYRLKENIAPMTGALATVQQLNPVTYTWKADGSAGQGFIAHELQAVVPDCVSGDKDAVETYVDEEGVEQTRPVYQGIDTSFLVATLTAAIKELSAKNDALEARIAALEGAANVSA